MAETAAMIFLMLAGLILAAVPLVLLAGINFTEIPRAELIGDLLGRPGTLWLGGVAGILIFGVVITVALALHAYVQSASVAIYLGAERQGRTADWRSFSFFTPERWMAAGRRYLGPVFWIYNIIWGGFGLIVLVPMIPILLAVLVAWGNTVVLVGAIFVLVFILIAAALAGLAVDFWVQVAVAVAVTDGLEARPAIRKSLQKLKQRLGDFALLIGFRIAAAIAIQGIFSIYYAGTGAFTSIPVLGVAFVTAHAVAWVIQTTLSILVSAAFIAAVVAVCIRQGATDAVHV